MLSYRYRSSFCQLMIFVASALVVASMAGCGADDGDKDRAADTKAPSGNTDESSEVHTRAIQAAGPAADKEQAVIEVEVRYRNPAASEVLMVWGLDQFTRLPAHLPPESFLTFNDSHINTPMQRDGDDFVARFEVEPNARLDYAFTVKRTSDGKAVELWKGANSAGEYYTARLTVANADEKVIDPKSYVGTFRSPEWSELHTRAVQPSGPAADQEQSYIEVEVRYRNPAASEMRLVWGLDQFTRRPAHLPPDTFLTFNDSHLNTPMQRDGDVFVTRFEVEPNARLDYAFTVTRTADGEAVELWKGANSTGVYFTANLSVANADEKVIDPKLYVGKFRSDEWSELHTRAIQPSGADADREPAVIEVQVRYRNSAASEMRLVWGLDQFTRVPPRLPPETFLTFNDSHINTPMQRDGDIFVARFEVEADARLDYAFTVTRTADGEEVELWKGADGTGGYFTANLSVANANEKVTKPASENTMRHKGPAGEEPVPPGRGEEAPAAEAVEVFTKAVWSSSRAYQRKERMIQVQVRYRNSGASEVLLIWGLNNFALVPKDLPPETFLTFKGSHINTPMTRQGDLFVVDFQAKPDARLDYAFEITRTSDGEPAKIWRGDQASGKEYTELLSVAGAKEIVDQDSVVSNRGSWNLRITVGVCALIVLWILFDLRRRKSLSPTNLTDQSKTS